MSLLSLSTELRHEIYSYLTPPNYHGIRAPSVYIITNYRPPPSILQRACRFLHEDINAYFYTVTTIQLLWYGGKFAKDARTLAVIQQARTMDHVMSCCHDWCDPSTQDVSFDQQHTLTVEVEMFRVLINEAKHLKKMVVSMMFSCTSMAWGAKEKRLVRLKELKEARGDLLFVAGVICTSSGYTVESRMKLVEYVKELNAKTA